mmetsp:Transcript_19842/g.33557  ORF Transcript_19842/g.33557 Transcript_19842/m.33557 type:complete len:316 (-) Transcript_19842:109-1056(-)
MPKGTESEEEELAMEKLLSLLVYEWQLSRTSPMGKPIGGVETRGNETSIALTPLTMYEKGCPPNFGVFYDTAKSLDGMENKRDAFRWYARSRLYYSCSTLCVAFVEFVVPELKRRGVDEVTVSSVLPSGTKTKKVCLDKIRVKSVFYTPKNVHVIRFHYFFGEKRDLIEVGGSHNNLECSDTGLIFDPTLGQLTGSMKPATFLSQDLFEKGFCGEVMQYMDSPGKDIQEQKQRDVDMAAMNKKPASHPKRIAQRVVDLFLSGESDAETRYCASCLGIAADGRKLLRCTRCNRVCYCSKYCQILDWKSHKTMCFGN